MVRTLPISEVKMKLTDLVTGVEKRGEEIVVTRNGRPAAILLSHAEYASLKETLDVLSDPDLLAQVRKSRDYFKKGKKGRAFEDVFGEPL